LIRLKHIWALFRKDLLLEIRLKYTFYGILLYVASTIFVLYLAMGQPEGDTWNGLFWMIQLFICVNSVAKSFLQENPGRLLYFYSIAGSKDFILSKLLFNAILMMIMCGLSLLLFFLFLGNPMQNPFKFLLITCFGSMSISLVFTFLAAIAARAGQNAAMMAILGFPLIIPQILLLIRLSRIAFLDIYQAGLYSIILLLAAFDMMIILLAIILFPFLWKD
jgi:heme exporter protein B